LKVLGKFLSHAAVGVPPEIMGIGPAYAIPRALEIANLCTHAVDVFQINEAFASQCTFSRDHLKIDPKKVNPKGGAIALGHPLGCTGAREVATLLEVLIREKKKLGVISMCIGTGMGAAAVIEAEW
jgi:acetyl-CoA acyltransferase 1